MGHEDEILGGRYRLGEIIGKGGMGAVYAARDLWLGRDVAVKMARASLPPLARAPSLLDEAIATSAISNEHAVRVLDVGASPRAEYMVMERLTGIDLDRLLEREGPLAPARAAEYVRQACEAIAEAHRAGIAHRDVKPSNLFLARGGDGTSAIKVLDFGVASAVSAEGSGFVGTPHYVAPEVAGGGRGDETSDVWSLGVVLYELVLGRVPFPGTSIAVVCAAILAKTPERLDAVDATVPAALADVVERCLAKNPAERYANASELLSALGRAQRGTSLAGVAVEAAPCARRAARPWSALALGAMVALAAAAYVRALPSAANAPRAASARSSLVASDARFERIAARIHRPKPR